MGVLTASSESSNRDINSLSSQQSDSDSFSSSEETRLLQKDKERVKPKDPYPKSIFFIIGNEFCERFCYYGLRTILTIYLTQRLYYNENSATFIYHSFSMLAYFTPIFGAILADSYIGKFRTILYVSILYTCGGFILSFGAIPNDLSTMKLVTIIGLIIIAVGTGGIKPCVSAFGGDQFKDGQEKQLTQFFSLFYLSINAGSLLSTIFTPVLREDVHCFGEKTCFSVAFGVPSILMVVALLFFVCGKPLYKIRPPEGNIVVKVISCICYALSKKCSTQEKSSLRKSHWLDRADDKFDKKLIEEIKILLNVLLLYLPLPVFWALFEQQASRWTLQAVKMDGVVGGIHIKPDQVQVINPFLIVAFIPLFEYVVYPILDKCHLLRKPLQRITAGGILAAISFVLAGLIQLYIESALPVMPEPGHSQLEIINNSPCNIKIEGTNLSVITAFKTGIEEDMILNKDYSWRFVPEGCSVNTPYDFAFNTSADIETMMITVEDESLLVRKTSESKEKSESGEPFIRILYNVDQPHDGANVSFRLTKEGDEKLYSFDTESVETIGITKYKHFPPGKYKIFLSYNQTAYEETSVIQRHFRSGGVYILSIYSKKSEGMKNATSYEMVKGSHVTILLQIPQYVVMTAGEIMFSITGLEFSYSQSPKSMKSVIQSAWLLTVAFGNLIVMIIAEGKFFAIMSHELFLFAVLMAVDMLVFSILAYFYKYVDIKLGGNSEEQLPSSSSGKSNEGYVEETDFNK